MMFYLGILVVTALYAAMGIGAEVHQRRTSTLSLAHGALAGTAAYVYALLSTEHVAAPLAAVIAICVSSGFGAVLALPARRLGSLQYTLVTFAVQALWSAAALGCRGITGGALGIADVPQIIHCSVGPALYLHVVLSVLLVVVAVRVLLWSERHPLSTAFAVLARSEELAFTLKLPTRALRMLAGSVHGVVIGAAGVLLASYLRFVDPTIFSIDLSVVVLAGSLVGRPRAWWGPLIGSVVLIAFPELLRLVGLGASSTAYLRLALSGAVLVLLASRSFVNERVAQP